MLAASGSVSKVRMSIATSDDNKAEGDFAAGSGDVLAPGTYPVEQAYSFGPPAKGPTMVVGFGATYGCVGSLTDSFTVREIAFSPGSGALDRLDVTFEQHCAGARAGLYGEFAYRTSLPPAALPTSSGSTTPAPSPGTPLGTPGLVISAGTVDFGSAVLGSSGDRVVQLTNTSILNLGVSVSVSGAAAGAFGVAAPACPPTIAPGGTCVIDVHFTAHRLGTAHAVLTVRDTSGRQLGATLVGTGVRPPGPRTVRPRPPRPHWF